jgi:hypothetical protein
MATNKGGNSVPVLNVAFSHDPFQGLINEMLIQQTDCRLQTLCNSCCDQDREKVGYFEGGPYIKEYEFENKLNVANPITDGSYWVPLHRFMEGAQICERLHTHGGPRNLTFYPDSTAFVIVKTLVHPMVRGATLHTIATFDETLKREVFHTLILPSSKATFRMPPETPHAFLVDGGKCYFHSIHPQDLQESQLAKVNAADMEAQSAFLELECALPKVVIDHIKSQRPRLEREGFYKVKAVHDEYLASMQGE